MWLHFEVIHLYLVHFSFDETLVKSQSWQESEYIACEQSTVAA